jgi:hypothetical protein
MPISPGMVAECTEVASSLLPPLQGWFLLKYQEPWADARGYILPRLRRFMRLLYSCPADAFGLKGVHRERAYYYSKFSMKPARLFFQAESRSLARNRQNLNTLRRL